MLGLALPLLHLPLHFGATASANSDSYSGAATLAALCAPRLGLAWRPSVDGCKKALFVFRDDSTGRSL